MSNDFIPLIPTPAPAPAAPDNLVRLPAPRSRHDAFAGLAPNPSGPVPAPTTPSPSPAPHSAPTVTFKRNGDRVTQIEIRCSCGEVIQLDCDYSASPQG